MELIPFLIFIFIAFKIFSGFTKTASKSGGSAKAMMRRLNEEIEKAEKLQNESSHIDRYRKKAQPNAGEKAFKVRDNLRGVKMVLCRRVHELLIITHERQRRREKRLIKVLSNMAAAVGM